MIYSTAFLVVGLLLSLSINGYIRDFDKYHWLILGPIIFPLAGAFYSTIGIKNSKQYWRLASVLLLLANLGLALVIFVTYAFSYWQF